MQALGMSVFSAAIKADGCGGFVSAIGQKALFAPVSILQTGPARFKCEEVNARGKGQT